MSQPLGQITSLLTKGSTEVTAFLTPFVVIGYRNIVPVCRPPAIGHGSTIFKADYLEYRMNGPAYESGDLQTEGRDCTPSQVLPEHETPMEITH
jgi:hypothetical protein